MAKTEKGHGNGVNGLFSAQIPAMHNKAMHSQYNAARVKCTLKEQRRSKLMKSTAPIY